MHFSDGEFLEIILILYLGKYSMLILFSSIIIDTSITLVIGEKIYKYCALYLNIVLMDLRYEFI
jgi:hypothetical protein